MNLPRFSRYMFPSAYQPQNNEGERYEGLNEHDEKRRLIDDRGEIVLVCGGGEREGVTRSSWSTSRC